MIKIIDNSISDGMEECNKAFNIFQVLGHENIYKKHKEDLDKLLNKIVPSNV